MRLLSRRALRATVFGGGIVATAAGLDTVVRGARSLPGERAANRVVESELRFYGAFYAAYGLAVLRAAGRADRDAATVRTLGAALFMAGLARAWGWVAVGRPHPLQQALLAIELGAPPAIVAWQLRLGREGAAPA